MEIEGIYYKTLYRNTLSGETSFYVTPNNVMDIPLYNGLLKCSGTIGIIVKGMPIIMNGDIKNNEFIITNYKIASNTKEQSYKIINYIDSDISDVLREKIVNAMDNNIIDYVKKDKDKIKVAVNVFSKDIIEKLRNNTASKEETSRFYKIVKLIEKIYTKIESLLLQEELTMKLLNYGVDIGKIEVFCEKDITLDKIYNNPYMLLQKFDIPITVSEAFFYENANANSYDIKRLCGFIYDGLKKKMEDGNACYEVGEFLNYLNRRISNLKSSKADDVFISVSILFMCVEEMNSYIRLHTENEKIYLYFNHVYDDEMSIIINIKRIENSKKLLEITNDIDKIEQSLNIKYNKEQRESFKLLNTTGIKILTGPPGSGKTSVIRGFIEYFKGQGVVILSATTGMAAKVMTKACNKKSFTVNKMLEIKPFNNSLNGKTLNNPIDADLIIVDEVSMLGEKLFSALLNAVKTGSILLVVGDEDQLQSVEYGSVFHSLIESEKIETYRLKEILRQSGTICENAQLINKGICGIKEDYSFVVNNYMDTSEAISDMMKIKKSDDVIITPTKLYQNKGTKYLNSILQDKNADVLVKYGDINFRKNDKIVMTKNNYESDYINGDLGKIIDYKNDYLVIDFGDRILNIHKKDFCDIDLAYALTIHKSQGSEFDIVHILLQDNVKNLITRRLIYTAITRAKKRVIIYNVNNALQEAISNVNEQKRVSLLSDFLQK